MNVAGFGQVIQLDGVGGSIDMNYRLHEIQ